MALQASDTEIISALQALKIKNHHINYIKTSNKNQQFGVIIELVPSSKKSRDARTNFIGGQKRFMTLLIQLMISVAPRMHSNVQCDRDYMSQLLTIMRAHQQMLKQTGMLMLIYYKIVLMKPCSNTDPQIKTIALQFILC